MELSRNVNVGEEELMSLEETWIRVITYGALIFLTMGLGWAIFVTARSIIRRIRANTDDYKP